MAEDSIWQFAEEERRMDSAVDFPTKTRFHIALNVKRVEYLAPFYRALFGQEPHTVRAGYVKFDLREPPLNLSLNEVPHNAKGNGRFGIEAKAEAVLHQMSRRLELAGFKTTEGESTSNGAGLHLVVVDPEGNEWEFFTSKIAS